MSLAYEIPVDVIIYLFLLQNTLIKSNKFLFILQIEAVDEINFDLNFI